MNIGMAARLKRIVKVLACLCAIELCLPGGTLLVLGYVLTGGRNIHAWAETRRGLQAWRDLRGLVSSNTEGGEPLAGPGRANRRAGREVPSIVGRAEMSWTWVWIGESLVLGFHLGVTLMSLLMMSRTRG